METIELNVDKKWKYIAKDANGEVNIYIKKPEWSVNAWISNNPVSYGWYSGYLTDVLNGIKAKNSLRKIVHTTKEEKVILDSVDDSLSVNDTGGSIPSNIPLNTFDNLCIISPNGIRYKKDVKYSYVDFKGQKTLIIHAETGEPF